MNPSVSLLVVLSARIFRLLPAMLAAMALAAPFVRHAEGMPKNWCVLVEDELPLNASAEPEWEGEDESDLVKEIPGLRPPFADEVGSFTGREGLSILPLPGLPLDTSFDAVGWIPQGPAPTKRGGSDIPSINPTDPLDPAAGAVQAIAPHPSSQNIMYIGTVNGGVWRTNNALATFPRWKALTDDQMSLSIGGLAMDPNDATGNTLVAGIGRRSSIAQLGGAHKGLLRTTDGGASWTAVGATALAGRSIYNLAVRGNIFLCAVPFTDGGGALPGLYRTTDGGVNFTNMSGFLGSGLPVGAVTHLAADATNSTRFYVHVASTGVYRSVDSGATWTNISAGMAAANVADLALAVGSGGSVFAAEVTATARVYRSINQGAAWTQMDSVLISANGLQHCLVGDPASASLVYISGITGSGAGRVLRGDASLAAGSQWVSISNTGAVGTGTGPHTDSRAMAFTAGNRLIEGDDGGVYELPIANTGSQGSVSKWRSLLGNLQDGEMHSVTYDPVAGVPFGGLQDNGLKMQEKSGVALWDQIIGGGGDGGDSAADLLQTPGVSIRYGGAQYLQNFFRATYDANNNQTALAFPPTTLVGGGTAIVRGGSGNVPFVTPHVTNAVAGGRLIIGGNALLYESTDLGNTVQQVDNNGPSGIPFINSKAKMAYGGRLAGANVPDVVFYGAGSTIRYRTTLGAAFSAVNFPGGTVQGIIFDPENWKTAYAIGTTTVYAANDIPANGAAAFTNITGNLTGVGTMHTLDYLTLPTGNAILAGTDLGAFIMRVSAPGVWKTLGDNLPHVPVFDSQFDVAGQILVASTLGRGAWLYDFKPTKMTGQYGETFQAYVDGTSTLPITAGELFSTHLGTAAKVKYVDVRELELTADGIGFTRTAFRLPDLNPGRAVPAFSAKWNATLMGDFGNLADGFSINFGPLGGVTGAAFTNGTYNNEDGFNAGVTVSVRTFSGAQPGYYVRVNGAVVAGGYIFKASSDWGHFNTTRHFFEVDWRMDTGLTLRVDGTAIFTNLPTPGYLPAAGDRFVFGARTGASDEEMSLDNIAIFTGGVLAPVQATAPYHFSAENGPSEGAAKAFDGNVNTRWFAPDYTGFIGASFPAAKTVRLYTLTSANDTPGRDLAAWDFQTGNDGVLWAQHGAQSAQFFTNRFEQRAFVVANPAAASKFRVLISDNHEALELQLAEFQPWEFIPVPASFTVANNSDSGAGSLRQSIANAAPFAGQAAINFAPALASQTITLTSGPLQVNNPDGVVIDASALIGGLIITANNASGLMTVSGGGVCTLQGLTLTGGNSTDGGAIFNLGRLSLQKCTLSGNQATSRGGAIYSQTNSDFTSTTTDLTYCTISGNSASTRGGGIYNHNGRTTLTRCTVAANMAPAGSGSGVASFGDSFTETVVRDSIIAQNTNSDVDFVVGSSNNSFTSSGFNLVGSGNALPDFNQLGDQVNTAPLLAPLDNYGGSTKTMALILNSPARNTGSNLVTTGDQRGFPIVGTPDKGAYEAGTLTNFNAFVWETLPASATIAEHAAGFDYDGDGATNFNEWLALTNPGDRASLFRMTNITRTGANVNLTFTTVIGRNYTSEFSTDLVSWTPLVGTVGGTGNPFTITIGPVTGFNKLFFRIRTGP